MLRKTIAISAIGVALAGCNGDGFSPHSTVLNFDPSVFSVGFVQSFDAVETIAQNLRDFDSRYKSQDVDWTRGGSPPVYNSYFLDHANVEYAHAVGLTGAGEVIAIVDSGFLTSHVEFSGKSHHYSSGSVPTGDLYNQDHGTGVASVASGSNSAGQMVGVAPGADLLFAYYTDFPTLTIGANEARSLGAIALNNSWGYESYDARQSDFDQLYGGSAAKTYLNALKGFATGGIIVWAGSNDNSRTISDLSSAVPLFEPSLEKSWITVVDAVPTTSGQDIVGATLISSACHQSARWCMAADGTAVAADAANTNSYSLTGGTSFAAPQVSGALAILAEAFPALTAQELRVRLLASANNSFYSHDGYVQFATGVQHGYNSTFGHGFLDLKAALLPIGSSFSPRSDGTKTNLDGPLILSGGASGDAMVRSLAEHDMVFYDGLGTSFNASADILTATPVVMSSPFGSMAFLFEADLDNPYGDPFHQLDGLSAFTGGQEIKLAHAGGDMALYLPHEGSANKSFGIEYSRLVDLGGANLDLGFSVLSEDGGFVGARSLVEGERLAALHTGASFDLSFNVARDQTFALSASLGGAVPTGDGSTFSFDPAAYNAMSMTYGFDSVLSQADHLSFGLSLPQAVTAGSAQVELPVIMGTGHTFANADISLAPRARQVDVSLSYGVPLSGDASILMSATHSTNLGHVKGAQSSTAALGWRLSF